MTFNISSGLNGEQAKTVWATSRQEEVYNSLLITRSFDDDDDGDGDGDDFNDNDDDESTFRRSETKLFII